MRGKGSGMSKLARRLAAFRHSPKRNPHGEEPARSGASRTMRPGRFAGYDWGLALRDALLRSAPQSVNVSLRVGCGVISAASKLLRWGDDGRRRFVRGVAGTERGRKQRGAARRGCAFRSAVRLICTGQRWTTWWQTIIRCGRCGHLLSGLICRHSTKRSRRAKASRGIAGGAGTDDGALAVGDDRWRGQRAAAGPVVQGASGLSLALRQRYMNYHSLSDFRVAHQKVLDQLLARGVPRWWKPGWCRSTPWRRTDCGCARLPGRVHSGGASGWRNCGGGAGAGDTAAG